MARFNLLDEPWIRVITDTKGNTKEVSLKDVFENAHIYNGLAGDMETQDFALMRLLLAVMHTVFSRCNAQGEKYDYLELDERFRQIDNIDEDDLDDYLDNLYGTWFDLWEAKEFPSIVREYLEQWRDRFYLFDEKYPFYQVNKDLMIHKEKEKLLKESNKKTGKVFGKNINYLICESENKVALFSPKYEANNNKECLNESQIARWLLTYQGYTGTGGKQTFRKKGDNETWSKGWIYDIGGLYFKADNLFQTLMLNFMIVPKEHEDVLNIQKPCWEYSGEELVERYLSTFVVDNLAELYTNWSRAIYIDSNLDLQNGFECIGVKLLEIDHQNTSLEPMTIWKYNKDGVNKDSYTPRKHQAHSAMWRSFGLIAINDGENRRAGIVDWVSDLREIAKECERTFISDSPMMCAVSMQDDGTSASWVPTDEIIDYLAIDEYVLADLQEDGWVVRINEVVEQTKRLISVVFKNYLLDIKKIRNISSDAFSNQKQAEIYYKIDQPFREWLSSIRIEDEKDVKVKIWKDYLKRFLVSEAEDVLKGASARDFTGIELDGKIKNIATAHNRFIISLNKEL